MLSSTRHIELLNLENGSVQVLGHVSDHDLVTP